MRFKGSIRLAGILDSSSVATPLKNVLNNYAISNLSGISTLLYKMTLMVLLFFYSGLSGAHLL